MILEIYEEFSQGMRRGCETKPLADKRSWIGPYSIFTSSERYKHNITLRNPAGIPMAQGFQWLSSFAPFLPASCHPNAHRKCLTVFHSRLVGESSQVQLPYWWQRRRDVLTPPYELLWMGCSQPTPAEKSVLQPMPRTCFNKSVSTFSSYRFEFQVELSSSL